MRPNPIGWLRRRIGVDTSTDTVGIRGAGASSQADFGEPISEEDLLFAVQREPVAYRIVFQVAHDIFDNWFKAEDTAEKPDPDFDKQVQMVLARLNGKSVFTQMAVFERLFGWSIIVEGYADHGKTLEAAVESPQEIRDIVAYSPLQFSVQTSDEETEEKSERFGLPVLYTLARTGINQVKVHFSRVIHSATRLLTHPYKGISVLEPVYDDLTVLRNVRWGLGQTIFRYGSGFPDVEVQGATKKILDDLEESQQFKSLQSRTYFLHSEKTKLDFKGLAGRALDPEPYYLPIMENISAGSGVPLAILRGAQAGELAGSEVNEREYFKLVSDAQSRYEPGIRALIDALIACGQVKTNVKDYKIVRLGGFEVSEKDKALVELNLAQAREKKSAWMTIDEIRAEEGLKELPAGLGKVVLGIKRAEQQLFSQSQNMTEERKSEENRNKSS
jgi:hypothetical protein